MYCSNCGSKLNEGADICLECGKLINSSSNSSSNDKPSVGLNIVAFFFPLIGLIMYLAVKEEKPKRASSIATAAWIGFVVDLWLLFIIYS